jgi:hypothetical protein
MTGATRIFDTIGRRRGGVAERRPDAVDLYDDGSVWRLTVSQTLVGVKAATRGDVVG